MPSHKDHSAWIQSMIPAKEREAKLEQKPKPEASWIESMVLDAKPATLQENQQERHHISWIESMITKAKNAETPINESP